MKIPLISNCWAARVGFTFISSILSLQAATEVHDFIGWNDFGIKLDSTSSIFAPKFDTQNGTRILQSVQISIEGEFSANVEAFNLSNTPAPSFYMLVDGALSIATQSMSPSISLKPTLEFEEYYPLNAAGSSGGSHDFGMLKSLFYNSKFALADNFSSYAGMGDFEIRLASNGVSWFFNGTQEANVVVTNASTTGFATVTYTYDTVAVPEPSSAVLATFAGMLFLMCRRRH